jgi:hypothetical protein
MENKIIQSTNVGPMVEMDVSGKICISGKAMMEDASLYFAACHEWIDQYIASKKESLHFEIELNILIRHPQSN